MSTRKFTCKKANCFEVLGETVEEQENTSLMEPSSITTEQDSTPSDMDFDLKESFQ